jgi:hypothetical protein
MNYLSSLPGLPTDTVMAALLALLFLLQTLFGWIILRRCERRMRSAVDKYGLLCRAMSGELDGRFSALAQEQKESMGEVRRLVGRMELRRISGNFSKTTRAFDLDKKHHVVSLAQRGLDAADISKKLKIYQGETELVLGLKDYAANRESSHERNKMH